MRVLAFALVALVAATGAAHADDDDEDEDGEFVPLPKRSIGLTLQGHGTRIGGESESGFGPALELAIGRGRWQYFIEGGFATAGMNRWTTGALQMRVDGRVVRGGLGTRWLARQFRPDRSGGIELFLMSLLGVERYYLQDATRLTRPELAFGFGLQGRVYKRPRLAFRLDARVLFTPNSAEHALVACRGRCMEETGSSTGFMAGFGIAW